MSTQPQCNAITKSGKRCSRPKHHLHSAYCAQHASAEANEETSFAEAEQKIKEGEQSLPPLKKNGLDLGATNAEPLMTVTPAPVLTTSHLATVVNVGIAAKLASRLAPTVSTVPHLVVEARAGTGKTTTLIEGLKRLRGVPTPGFVPSPQQEEVFKQMELSRDARTICFVAFNKSIANELKMRVPYGCEASTMHAMGFAAVKRSIRLNNSNAVNEDRVSNIICELEGVDIFELRRRDPILLGATKKLVSLVKMNLSGTEEEDLDALVSHYSIDFAKDDSNPTREKSTRDKVYDLVPKILERCKDVVRDGFVDYDDMVWLPVALDLPMVKYDLLLVDERQDLNKCQMQLALKAGRRIVAVGDEAQSIYGFAGADAEASQNFKSMLEEIGGVVSLPLTVTRRCGKAIVKEAQRYVPDFQAHESNGDGTVNHLSLADYHSKVSDGDMILSRTNAPLVSECFRFLKLGRKANIQGRDIGQGLISLVTRLGKDQTVAGLVQKIDVWMSKEIEKELSKRYPSDARLLAIEDKAGCLQCFTEDCDTVQDVIRKIESIFTDDKSKYGILLSSIHKAKGLESSRVFYLQSTTEFKSKSRQKGGWQTQQEENLKYVAVTRAIKELTYVS